MVVYHLHGQTGRSTVSRGGDLAYERDHDGDGSEKFDLVHRLALVNEAKGETWSNPICARGHLILRAHA